MFLLLVQLVGQGHHGAKAGRLFERQQLELLALALSKAGKERAEQASRCNFAFLQSKGALDDDGQRQHGAQE